MSAKLQVQTRVRRLIHYIEDLEKGIIQIPSFQRDYIWDKKNNIELFNSLKMGYPIGSILFWKPNEDYGSGLKIGPFSIPQNKDGLYILDGFQRLSTIFGCLINPQKTPLKADFDTDLWKKKFQICYDLQYEVFVFPRKTIEPFQIPLYELIDTRESFKFEGRLRKLNLDEDTITEYMDRYSELGTTLVDFQLPSIDIIGGEIEEAVEIFSKINSEGSKISPDWMVSALTFNNDGKFRLGTVIDDVLEELRVYNFKSVNEREWILQCIQSSFGKIYFEFKIAELVKTYKNDSDYFMSVVMKTTDSIKKAVKFLFEELLVIDSKLLPANIQLIFITEFFNIVQNPTSNQYNELKKWFWRTTYSNYFTVFSPSKRKEAFINFQNYWKGDLSFELFYNDKPNSPFSVGDFPNKILFGSVRAKALTLFLINYSNNFKSVLSQDVENFKLSNLFSNYRNDNYDFPSENAIPLINWREPVFPKTKDLSFLLVDHYEDWYDKFFLTEEMRLLLEQGNKEEILNLRKILIMVAEKSFVENLGLVYEE